MTEDRRLINIENKLDRHGEMLGEINMTLQKIAVQDEQIRNMNERVSELWRQWDEFTSPDGPLSNMQAFQASCPRRQLPGVWWAVGIVVTVDLALIGWLIQLVGKVG